MDVREGIPAVRNHGHEGDGTMQTVKAFRGNARTFLTHMFGRGLDDDRYVIERFRSKADGEIHPRRRNGAKKSRRRVGARLPARSSPWAPSNGSRDGLAGERQVSRPERDEIIVCTGIMRLFPITGGIQYWGDRAMGFAGERQVSLRCDPRRRPAGFRWPDALHQDHHCGRKEHALQGSRERTRMRPAAL